jgi:hypothetical protein
MKFDCFALCVERLSRLNHSTLGPLFSILFINDISLNLDSECLLYADGLKLFKKISAYADHVTPQSDLGKVRSKRTFFERLEMQRDDILIETCQQVL